MESSYLKSVCEKDGRINKLRHARGVVDDELIMKQKINIRDVFEPKVEDTWFLHKHILIGNLKKIIMCSSVVALFGNIGQANYSALNEYSGILVRYHCSLNYSGISIQ